MELSGQNCILLVEAWLTSFNQAINRKPEGQIDTDLTAIFHIDSYWRDALALSWSLQTVISNESICHALRSISDNLSLTEFHLDPNATPPQMANRGGIDSIEAFIKFQTANARCHGIVRLTPDAKQPDIWRAWTLFTAIDELIGFEEKPNHSCPQSESYPDDVCQTYRIEKPVAPYIHAPHNPEVLVIGGGHAGLSIAARLKQLDIDTLIVDKNSRIGDSWRNRYRVLTLHNQRHVNHLPYIPFPSTWPTYIPKDMVASWFEFYTSAMDLIFRPQSDVTGASYDSSTGRWTVEIRQTDGGCLKISPRHVIMATGVSGIPNLPNIETLSAYSGPVVHSSKYHDGADWSGKHAIVIGCGNSGHDIAQDLYSSGAHVTMVQRGPCLVVNIEPSAQIPYSLYDGNRSIDECDFITASMPVPLTKKAHTFFTKQARDIDRQLLNGLEKIGFRLDLSEDSTGWQFKYLTRGGGYYFNVGCSDLLVDRKIKLVQFEQIDRFIDSGMRMINGHNIKADIIILATGYKPQEHLVRKLFGEEVLARIGPIWGYGNMLELRNMYCQTGQPGLWFIAGSFAQCRIYSKYLALQIKALEEKILPSQRDWPPNMAKGRAVI